MRACLLVGVLLSAGCGLTLDFEPDDPTGRTDAGRRDATADAPTEDARSDANSDAPDPCLDCPDGTACDATGECVSLCADVVCEGGTRCVGGECLCAGELCTADELCNGGVCVDSCGGMACEDDMICHEEVCSSPCDPSTCTMGDVCLEETNDCGPCGSEADCAPGEVCFDGDCAPRECSPDMPCPTIECQVASCRMGICGYEDAVSGEVCSGDGGVVGTCDGDGHCRFCGDGFWDAPTEACDASDSLSPRGCSPRCTPMCILNSDCRSGCDDGRCAEGECRFEPPPMDCRICGDSGAYAFPDRLDGDGDGFASCTGGTGMCLGVDAASCDCNDSDPRVNPRLPADAERVACAASAETPLCGLDLDGDGFPGLDRATVDGDCDEGYIEITADNVDCDDTPRPALGANANPDQVVHFGVPRPSGGYDYNCDGRESPKYTRRFEGCGPDCAGEGWALFYIPRCGEARRYLRCDDGSGECVRIPEERTQSCL